nr:MAG TPA: hypothetical protein [Caudoviricetes sp.]
MRMQNTYILKCQIYTFLIFILLRIPQTNSLYPRY